MKKIFKLILVGLLFTVGLGKVNAAAFKIGDTEYESLKDAVGAVPTDGTKTTIVMTEDVAGGAGVIVEAGKNIVIDFGGHRFETDAPMVGSTGTETQSFQLLKGSTVYMKNGTLIPSTRADSKMFIQNYSNLTLEDITIDGSTNPNAGFYAVSSNYGEVKFIGNTSIKVNPNISSARAFDMCWAPKVGNATYSGGTQMVIDTTGKIEGMIELDVWGTFSNEGGIKSTLTIKNIDFDGTWSIDERLAGQLSIEGGKFNSSVEEYVADGSSEYTLDNTTFEVLPTGTIKFKSNDLYVLKGKTANVEVEVEDLYKKYVEYSVVHEEVATYSNGVITGVASGNTTLNVSLGKLGDSAAITVYEVVPAASENSTEEQINEGANDVTVTIVEQALTEENVEGLDEETVENIKTAVLAGKTVETNVEVTEVEKNTIEEEVLNKLEEAAKKQEGEIAGYLNIDVLLQASGEELGKVTKLPNPIKVTVDVDSSLANVKDNVTRKFFVVRLHEGEEPAILEATYKDGKLEFETDRFSQYAYGYTDTEEQEEKEDTTIPKTGDNIKAYLILLGMSGLGVGIAFALKKRN